MTKSYTLINEKGEKKMKTNSILAVALVIFMLAISMYATVPVKAHARSDLDVIWYGSDTAAYAALKAGDIDFIQWSLSKEQLDDAQADPNLQVAAYKEMGMYEFDLNNNATIAQYPTSRNPCNDLNVRKALAYLVDKNFIVNFILLGFGARLDSPVPYPTDPTLLLSVNTGKITYDVDGDGVLEPGEMNYPWEHSVNNAAAALAAAGFNDTDGNGYLNYPDDASWGAAAGADTTTMPLKMCIRSDHVHRFNAGKWMVVQLEGVNTGVGGDSPLALATWPAGFVGGDFDTTDVTFQSPRAILSPIVMRDRNYHLYTGGWSLGRFPTFVFNGFHSMFWYPYGANYVTAYEHPDLDTYGMNVWLAKNVADAQNNSRYATGYMVDNVCNIPLWCYGDYIAWSKDLAGVVNMKGYGNENPFTFINAYRASNPNGAIRMGCVSGPDRLNVMYSQWFFEYAMLDRVYTGLINANPYDLAQDIPWVAKDWKEETYVDEDGLTKQKVTYYLREDVGCAAPITGAFSGFFNAYDLEWTIWYNYAYDDDWQWGSFMDIRYTKVVNEYTLEVYFDDLSIWFKYAPTYPLLGPKTILEPLLCEQTVVTFAAPAIGDEYHFTEYTSSPIEGVVEMVSATEDGNPIVEHTDFEIRSGYDRFCHDTFVNKGVTEGATIVLTYWKGIDGSASGFYIGGGEGLDWTDTMYSYGHHYPIDIVASVGGHATLNRNPWFFCSAPLLGECNWAWVWDGGNNWHNTSQAHPIGGNFKIDILDVVRATGAYCHRGDGVYDPFYFPGADLDASDLCHIGILDLVTITGKYAKTFCYEWQDYFCETTGSPFTCDFFVGDTKPTNVKTTITNNVKGLGIVVGLSAPYKITISGEKVNVANDGWVSGSFEQSAKVYAFKCYIADP